MIFNKGGNTTQWRKDSPKNNTGDTGHLHNIYKDKLKNESKSQAYKLEL